MSRTLEARVVDRIRSLAAVNVFVRGDFADDGGYDQVGRALRQLAVHGRLVRLGQGLYGRERPAGTDTTAWLERLSQEALRRLGGADAEGKIVKRVRRKVRIGDRQIGSARVPRPSSPKDIGLRGERLLQSEPRLAKLVGLARERFGARQVWLFGSRARGDHDAESDWDILLMLPDDAPDADLEPGRAWRIGRDAGLVADVVVDREGDVIEAMEVPNTLAFALRREGVRVA
jgi:predicted nucleotidyltransferase